MERSKKRLSIYEKFVLEFHRRRASRLLSAGKFGEALNELGRIIKINAQDSRARYDRAMVLLNLGEGKKSLESFAISLKLKPSVSEVWWGYGECLMFEEKYLEALKSYNMAIKLDPKLTRAWYGRGVAMSTLGRFEESVESLQKVLEVEQKNLNALYQRGCALGCLGRYEEALKDLEMVLELQPQRHYDFWRNRGTILGCFQRNEEALRSFDEAIKREPNDPQVWVNRAISLILLGKYDDGLESANRAIELRAHDVGTFNMCSALTMRGHAYLGMLEYSKAKAAFYKAATIELGRADDRHLPGDARLFCRGMYYCASAIEKYIGNQCEVAESDFQSAQTAFEKCGKEDWARLIRLLLENMKIDSKFGKLVMPRDIESLKTDAEQMLAEIDNIAQVFGVEEEETAMGILVPFFIKRVTLRLLVAVLNLKPLDEALLVRTKEIIERFPDSAWVKPFGAINLLLHRLASCRNMEEMKKKEKQFLKLAGSFWIVNGYATAQGLKITSWHSEIIDLLKQDLKQAAELKAELRKCLPVRFGAERPEAKTKEPYYFTVWSEEGKQYKITFTDTEVIIGNTHLGKSAPLLLSEYIILKQKEVHWLWAYIILPKFEIKKYTPNEQFRNYISKRRKELAEYGVHLAILKPEEDSFAISEGMDDWVISNIRDMRETYEKALSVSESNLKEAMKALACITEDDKNRWYSFTDAYMTLSRWICKLEFEEVSDGVIEKCINFFKWYLKRLKLGISKINRYRAEGGLSDESLGAFEKIKSEFREAIGLYSALIDKRPLDKEEQGYESFVNVLLHAHKALVSVRERSLGSEGEQDDSIKVIKFLSEKSRDIAEMVQYGQDALDKLLEKKGQRHAYSKEVIQDMHEDVCWEIANVILEIENFDKFDRKTGNKLRHLKRYLNSCLRNKLSKYE